MNEQLVIIILTYNRVKYLEKCIQSFLSQTHQEFKLIVLDNASDQDVEGMMRKFKDPRISLIRNETNVGCFRNYEKAWKMASGDFFMIFNDDDCAHPKMIESQIRVFKEMPSALFVLTGYELVCDYTEMLNFDTGISFRYEAFENHQALARAYLSRRRIGFGSTMYRTSILRDTQQLPERLIKRFSLCFDHPLLLSLAQRGPCAYLISPTFNVGQHDQQASRRLTVESDYTKKNMKFLREILTDTWDDNISSSFNRAATTLLMGTYIAWLKSKPSALPSVFRDLAKQDLIRPLTFFHLGAKLAMKLINRRVRRGLNQLIPLQKRY